MSAGEFITFLLLAIGAICLARPVSDLVNRIITKLRVRREVGIRLPNDDNGLTTKPFPRYGLVALAVAGILAQAFLVVSVLHAARRSDWRLTGELLEWLSIQIAYVAVYFALILLAFTYPRQVTMTSSYTFPFSWPVINLKRTDVAQANPGAEIQVYALVIFVLPFIASIGPYTWYNWIYWHNPGLTLQTVGAVTQPLIALVVFVYGTVVRQVCGNCDERSGGHDGQTAVLAPQVPASPQAGPSV